MGEESKLSIPQVAVDLIIKIIKRGNTAEVKRENNKIVVVEIQRKVRTKTSITG